MSDDNSKFLMEELGREVEYLKRQIEHLEGDVSELRNKLELKEIECDLITDNLAEIAEYNQDLERALAEAYLTSKEESPKST